MGKPVTHDGDDRGEWRDWLVKVHHGASQDYDKAVMTLAGGALGLSLTFTHEIAPDPQHVWTLAIAWGLLALSLLLIFITLLTSQYSLLHHIECIDKGTEVEGGIAGWLTIWLNGLSGASFVLGVAFLVWFAVWNV